MATTETAAIPATDGTVWHVLGREDVTRALQESSRIAA
jgi:hypothetical protein